MSTSWQKKEKLIETSLPSRLWGEELLYSQAHPSDVIQIVYHRFFQINLFKILSQSYFIIKCHITFVLKWMIAFVQDKCNSIIWLRYLNNIYIFYKNYLLGESYNINNLNYIGRLGSESIDAILAGKDTTPTSTLMCKNAGNWRIWFDIIKRFYNNVN